MKTTPAITASAMIGIITLKTWSGFVHHAWTPCGMREMMLAKIISEIPLPIPRCVISSPNHISRTVPLVSASTITNTWAKVKPPLMMSWPGPVWLANVLNRKT